MKPTSFLKNRYDDFLKETSGQETVRYWSFDAPSKSSLTGSVDESSAYPGPAIGLACRIDMYPNRAVRESIGLGVNFDAILRLSVKNLEENGIMVKIGDGFVLPGESVKRYVVRIVDRKQKQGSFIEQMVLVSRRPPGRG